MSRSALSRSLVTPTKLKSVLDWNRKSIMALDIDRNHVGISISDHPLAAAAASSASSPSASLLVRRLDPIPLPKRGRGQATKGQSESQSESQSQPESQWKLDSIADRIEKLASEHNVCAVVVGWPLQPGGNPGKMCGRVLHTLETLLVNPSPSPAAAANATYHSYATPPTTRKKEFLSKRRPFTLWDDRYATLASSCASESGSESALASPETFIEYDEPPDRWGRSVALARPPRTATLHTNADVATTTTASTTTTPTPDATTTRQRYSRLRSGTQSRRAASLHTNALDGIDNDNDGEKNSSLSLLSDPSPSRSPLPLPLPLQSQSQSQSLSVLSSDKASGILQHFLEVHWNDVIVAIGSGTSDSKPSTPPIHHRPWKKPSASSSHKTAEAGMKYVMDDSWEEKQASLL